MTKKVTGNDLKKLIENAMINPEALKTVYSDSGVTSNATKSSLFLGLELIAKADKPFTEITLEDFEKLIDDPTIVTTNVEHALYYFKNLAALSDEKLNNLKDSTQVASLKTGKKAERAKITYDFLSSSNAYETLRLFGKKSEEVIDNFYQYQRDETSGEQSISSPNLNPRRIELGDLPRDYSKLLNNYFGSTTGFNERIMKLSEKSSKYFNISQEGEKQVSELLDAQTIQEALSEIMILDLFNHVVKELDSGSGAYFFEAILGLIAGGRMSGKDLTPAGKAGAYDFVYADGVTKGSAKFFGKAQETIRQAVAGFEAMYEENNRQPISVKYVIAIKKQDIEQVGAIGRGSSDPSKIIALELYTPVVTFDGTSFKIDGQDAKITKDGKEVRFYPWLSKSESSSILYLAQTRTQTFRQGIEQKISTEKDNVQSAFKAFRDYFEYLNSAEEQARIYSSTGDIDDGTKTQGFLNQASTEVDNLSTAFTKQKEEQSPTNESKKVTADFLKKLISESLNK